LNILNSINSNKDLRRLKPAVLPKLCGEIREFLLHHVSQTGGHLASNLGTVELTVALHKVFNWRFLDMDYNSLYIPAFIMTSAGIFGTILFILCYIKTEKKKKVAKKDILIISFVSILIGLIPVIGMCHLDKKWKEEHRTGVYQCPRCQSYETEGFNTFWYKDGMLCNGSREYNLEHAHYTIMSCDYCGNGWRLYKKDW
jgi:hypothetical protein